MARAILILFAVATVLAGFGMYAIGLIRRMSEWIFLSAHAPQRSDTDGD